MSKNIVNSFIMAASPENLERVVVALYKKGMTLPADEAALIGNVVPMDTINTTAARLSAGTNPELWTEVAATIDSYDLPNIKHAFYNVMARIKALGTNVDNTMLPALSNEGIAPLFEGLDVSADETPTVDAENAPTA